jgi:hypothetical protein
MLTAVEERTMRFRKALVGTLVTSLALCSCASAQVQRGQYDRSPENPPQDSVIMLRTEAPPDSVVVHRGNYSILLSLAGIEKALAGAPPDSDEAALLSDLRRQYREYGQVELGEGAAEDYVAADLLKVGQAVVRRRASNHLIPWVRLRIEHESIGSGATIVDYQVFTAPDESLIMRVMSGVTIS